MLQVAGIADKMKSLKHEIANWWQKIKLIQL
jgi:hypothetical protein